MSGYTYCMRFHCFEVMKYFVLNISVILLLCMIQTGIAQEIGECNNCQLLRHCSEIQRIIRYGTSRDRNKINRRICGWEGNFIKVCCPKLPEKFLPKECGFGRDAKRIIGGNVTHLGSYPSMVALGYRQLGISGITFKCAGTVINERYVLTAAHCVHSDTIKNYQLKVLRFGEWNMSSDLDCRNKRNFNPEKDCAPKPVDLRASQILIHPLYNKRSTLSDDIALIRLNQSLDFDASNGYISPICMAKQGFNAQFIAQRRKLIAVGWGLTEKNEYSEVPLFVRLPFAKDSECLKQYGSRFKNEQLCVGGTRGKDTCFGDSGGPLILTGPNSERPHLQVGIVSYGKNASCGGSSPAVYTALSHYWDWIVSSMKPW